MTKRMAISLIQSLGTTLLLVLCGAVGAEAGDTFTSPMHNFSVKIPAFLFGTEVRKSNDKIHGWVAFTGGAGDMARVGYQRIDRPPATADLDSLARVGFATLDSLSIAMLREKIAGLDSLARDGLLKTLFMQLLGRDPGDMGEHPRVPDEILLGAAAPAFLMISNAQQALLTKYSPRIISREPMVLDSTLMVFTVAVSPEGSDSINLATGKHFDVVLGHLVFIRGEFLYNFVVQPNGPAAGLATKAANPEDEMARLDRRLLHELYRSVVFQ